MQLWMATAAMVPSAGKVREAMGLGAGWTMLWVYLDDLGRDKVEVFVSPDNHWYKRASGDDTVDLRVGPLTYTGVTLELTNIDHWRPSEDDPNSP